MNYQKLQDQLRQMEGERLTAYQCSQGYWTVGVGRNLETVGLSDTESLAILGEIVDRHEAIERLQHLVITPEQSEMLFMADLSRSEEQCYRNIRMNGNNARRAVIINMCFQLGISGLLGFTNTLAFYESENYIDTSVEMMNSKWAREDTPSRAEILRLQMKTGQWQ